MEFRLQLHLYHFFIDYRKVCLIYVRKNVKTIKDLISYISKYFQIDRHFYLTSKEFYLPDFEDIRVLNEDDVVVAVPQTSYFEEKQVEHSPVKKSKKKDKVVNKDFSEDIVEKRKKNVEDNLEMMVDLEIDEVDHSKKKNCNKDNQTWHNAVRDYTRKRKIDPLPVSTCPNIVKTILVRDDFSVITNGKEADVSDADTSTNSTNHISDNNNIASESVMSEIDLENVKVKRKRKRVRHRRKPEVDAPVVKTPIAPIIGMPTVHIRFDDDQHQVDEPSASTLNECKEKEPEEVIELEEYKPERQINYDLLCKNKITTFPLMNEKIPNSNDVIAFKRYKLSQTFTPEISNYIIGRVLSYCSDSQAIFMKILEGHEECKDPEGKFFWQLEEEQSISDEKQFVWSELIEPRLLFP